MLHFTEKIESQKVLRLLSRSIPYYLKSWTEEDAECGLFGVTNPTAYNMHSVGSSSPVIEYVIRPHLNIICILGSYLYLKQEELISALLDRETLIRKIRGAARWACATHLTGERDVDAFLNRKRWGENWRSGFWAAQLGIISVLCKDILDNDTLERIRAILAFEADRFIGLSPPTGCETDTKTEENAQDMMLLAWAIACNPDHANRSDWERTMQIWSVNIASNIHDKTDHEEYFSSCVAHLVSTQNLFPDMTAENHGFFHPEVLAYGSWIVIAMAAYLLHGQPCPTFLARKSHQRTFEILLRFCLPNGLIYTPGGHDMPMFVPRPLALAWGLWHNDPRAMHITGKLLSWMDTCLLTNLEQQGPWVFGFEQNHEGWELLFQSQVGFELAMLACLPFSKEQRMFSAGQIENAIDTRHTYPYVEVCYRRNVRSTRSIAWKAIGGHPLIGFNVHNQAELVVPFKAALLGIPSVAKPVKSWKVAFHHDGFQRDGFDSWGRILYFDATMVPLLHRDIRVITWGDEGMVVLDAIFADTGCEVHEQYLSPVYLVNDHWTGQKLDFTSGSLRESISSFQRTYREINCPSFWASVENNLVFQFIWGRTKGLYFLPGGERNAPPYWKNCRVDMLAVHVEPQTAAAGTIIYKVGYYIGAGKGPRPFKSAGKAGEFYKGLVIMDGKSTVGLT
ncbi:MAG: hypothetical protein JXA18_02420 [Chitinispirillaceae bacterium]|nr:hypothetical protein [Chitinispirillaceae bacterium]